MQWFAAMILWKKEKITSVHVNQHIIILSNAPCPKIKRPPLRSLNIFELKQGFPTAKDSWWFGNPANHFIIIWISFIIVISKVYSSLFKNNFHFPWFFFNPIKHHPHSFPGFPCETWPTRHNKWPIKVLFLATKKRRSWSNLGGFMFVPSGNLT